MLKRPIVSLFSSLKSKGKRFYWVPTKSEEYNKLSLIKDKYNIPNDIFISLQELLEIQETKIKELNNQLTNQQKVIEKIYNIVEHINKYNYGSRFLQSITLFYIFLFKISMH